MNTVKVSHLNLKLSAASEGNFMKARKKKPDGKSPGEYCEILKELIGITRCHCDDVA
jgi:hypothetical protein